MAGDHKCSVCQATFTRPQHVSRHMRSRKSLRSLLLTPRSTHPQIQRYRRSPIQVSALWRPVRQKVCFSLHLPSPAAPLISISLFLAISSRDMLTSAIPTRNLLSLPLPLAAKVPLPPAGPPPQSKPVTNVFSRLCHAMGPILVVSDPYFSSLDSLTHALFPSQMSS